MEVKLTLCCAALAGLSLPALAQDVSNPLSQGQKAIYSMVSGALIRAAEKMPAEDYAFKPTPDVRSFGQLVGHVADAQYGFCSTASGDKSTMRGIEKTKTAKADLVQLLKDAVAYCDKIYDGMTDIEGSQIITAFGRPAAKLSILSFNTAHSDEHYGNMVTYLRLKGIVPPTSEDGKVARR